MSTELDEDGVFAADVAWGKQYARQSHKEYLEFLASVRKRHGTDYSTKVHKGVQKQMKILEGVEIGDLKRLVEPKITVDSYRSKMGDDKDICVVSFTVFGKEPAQDLADFTEKSYDWVLDADVSSGEASDGNYVVFIELERDKKTCDHIMTMVTDILNLTEQKIGDWTFSYYKSEQSYPLTAEELVQRVISTPEKYEAKFANEVKESHELNALRAIAGIEVKAPAITDPALLSIQIAAGIK